MAHKEIKMASLSELLESIKDCSACWLMSENRDAGVRYVPVLPKPNARFMLVGRDPSPRTAKLLVKSPFHISAHHFRETSGIAIGKVLSTCGDLLSKVGMLEGRSAFNREISKIIGA